MLLCAVWPLSAVCCCPHLGTVSAVTSYHLTSGHGTRAMASRRQYEPFRSTPQSTHRQKLFVGSEGNSGNECKDLLNSMRYPQAPEPCEQPAVVSAAPLLRHHRRGHRQGGGQVGAVQYSTVQYSAVQYSTVQCSKVH